ncbi:MAG: glycosyltransferase family 4 protein [Candidatus Brocadiaceae bacterium]|jgi:glycosyltransferase involved in cell wall biosynthesis
MADAPVRVVQIITRMILGGAQQSVLYLCEALRQRGWDALLLTGPPLGPEGELLTDAARRGIPCRLVPEMRREVHPWRDGLAFVKLVHLLRHLRPAIVHTHSSKAGVLGRLAARVARVPIVIHTIRGLPFHPYAPAYQNLIFRAAERVAATVTDHFSCVAQAMVDGAVAAGLGPRERFTVVRSGIDIGAYQGIGADRERVRRRFGLQPDDFVIGKIARLFDLKGHRFLIRAAPKIVARCPEARFLFVGEGILRGELEELAEEFGVRDRISFAGLLPPEQIPAVLGAMDVLVHASLREGLARVLVQALLCEKPVVTYALDGAPEVIVEGVTGRLVPGKSIQELADAVLWVAEHRGRAQAMAREGRRRFADEFSIEQATTETEQLYRRLLARKAPGTPLPPTSPPRR